MEGRPHFLSTASERSSRHEAADGIRSYEARTEGRGHPCNVIVRAINGGDIMVSAIDPVASMQAIDNDMLKSLAGKNRSMLEDVVAEI